MKKPNEPPSEPIAVVRQKRLVDSAFGAQLIHYSDEGAPFAREPEIVRFLKEDMGVASVFIESEFREDQFWQSIQDRIYELHMFEFLYSNRKLASVNINALRERVFIDFKDQYGNVISSFVSRIDSQGHLGSGYVVDQTSGAEIARSIKDEGKQVIRGGKGDDEPSLSEQKELEDDNIYKQFTDLSYQDQQQLFSRLSDFMTAKKMAVSSPHVGAKSPPEGKLYADRGKRSETAPAFIERVYGTAGWLNGEFTRADFRKLDPVGEKALRDWEFRNKERAAINLPTLKEKNDWLAAQPPPPRTEEEREAHRHREIVRTRQAKTAKFPDPS